MLGRARNLRDWVALKYDVQCGDEVHGGEHGHDHILRIDVPLPVLRNPHQHVADRELDGDDGDAVEDFEQEEPKQPRLHVVLVARLREPERVDADTVE